MQYIEKEHFFMKCAKLPNGTAQTRRISSVRGRIRTYPSDSYASAKKQLKVMLKRHVKSFPYSGPVSLEVAYRYETSVKKNHYKFKTTRPDGDNLLKVLKDCMTELGFFFDDSQVCYETICRYWVPKGEGGIYITIGPIEEAVF